MEGGREGEREGGKQGQDGCVSSRIFSRQEAGFHDFGCLLR